MLLVLSDMAGTVFGTEDFSIFLYSLIRMHAPTTIVELGTGLGVSAFWMAAAAKRNGTGHVWTIDDFEWFKNRKSRFEEILARLRRANLVSIEDVTPERYFQEVSALLGLDQHLTVMNSKFDLEDTAHISRYPFAATTIDLLFSDFKHGPVDVLALLGQFLPRMSICSSIFVDSASTLWPSYLLLEHLISQLNAGKIPKSLQDASTVDLNPVMRNRRIVLVHLTKWRENKQNSAAWLKIEPVDLVPYPKTKMRGMLEL